jgi:hypothetical protein
MLGEDFKYNKSEIDLRLEKDVEFQKRISKTNGPDLNGTGEEIKLDITNVNFDNTVNAVLKNRLSVTFIENVLQMYSLNQLYFSNLSQEKLKRYDYTLNIQWAIDIKNSLNVNGS